MAESAEPIRSALLQSEGQSGVSIGVGVVIVRRDRQEARVDPLVRVGEVHDRERAQERRRIAIDPRRQRVVVVAAEPHEERLEFRVPRPGAIGPAVVLALDPI